MSDKAVCGCECVVVDRGCICVYVFICVGYTPAQSLGSPPLGAHVFTRRTAERHDEQVACIDIPQGRKRRKSDKR